MPNITNQTLFQCHVAPTSPFPALFEVDRAENCWIWNTEGRRFLDFISGIAVVNVGHSHPKVVDAVCEQMRRYAHTMVYGEHVQRAQVELAQAIASVAPPGLDTTYFVTSGAEANDAALKMAVKLTGRSKLIAFHKAYHGDTVGALACFGEEQYRRSFTSLLSPVEFLPFGLTDELYRIDSQTAAVLVEPVQGEAGIRIPPEGWLHELRARCTEASALLIFDEVQTGFGRLGSWFAAEKYGVIPDVMTMAKGMGMGMPLGGVLSSRDRLFRFAADPPFSHITTFGGHPVSCAAGLAGFKVIQEEGLLENTSRMGTLLLEALNRLREELPELIVEVRGVGLMIGIEVANEQLARALVESCRAKGLLVETTLLSENVVRFSPPLVVSAEQCAEALDIFTAAARQAVSRGAVG